MSLLEKYLQGNRVGVYEEMAALGQDAFKKNHLADVNAVLDETMMRVKFNLEIIFNTLKDINYCFAKNPKHDFEHPLLAPRWPIGLRIARLERGARKLGQLPLSLKKFYQIVGSCNFAWDYDTNPIIPWEEADPLQIAPITVLMSELKDLEADDEPVGLPVSADFYHKDNISGGPPYSIELTAKRQVDSRFLNEEHETTFINYLRITFDNCGFSRSYAVADLPEFIRYSEKVRPLLKPI